MEYGTQHTGISTGVGGYEPAPSCNETERESYSDSVSNPFGEFYSVGIDETVGLKEKITDIHGADSEQVGFISELEDFLSDSDKYCQASHKYKTYVRNHINTPRNADHLVDEFVNSGYIMALERLRAPNSENDLDFYKDYAATHSMTVPQAVLFGPNGTARQAFSKWRIEELLRGQHRSNRKPENKQMAEAYDKAANNTYRLPEVKNKDGEQKQIDISDDKGKLPKGLEGQIVNAFNREPQLYYGRWYKGTKRLKGDLSYRIVEAIAAELLKKQKHYKSDGFIASESELEKVIEDANEAGQDAFLALYNHYDKNKRVLKYVWDKARKTLNDYAEILWQQRDNYREQIEAKGRKELPGTIYLNNGRYYWMPKHGEKAISLIPDKEKNKLPGSLIKNKPGGYFWWIPHLKFRRRMVPDGQKVATKDLKTAKKLQLQEWKKIQKYEPQLAEKLKGMRKWGTATKHKPTAVKIAKKYWNQMQKSEPQITARIMSDKRPETTKPEMDVVWPSWTEQKTRLALIENKPQMPIVYPEQGIRDEWEYGLHVPENLEAMVDKIKKVDWMVSDAMLVFDDNSPVAPRKIAVQSNGKEWTNEQEKNEKRLVTQGSTSIDRDTGRIRFTIYSPGYGSKRTLAEEVYHTVFGIIRETSPRTFRAIQAWHKKNIDNGSDPTLNISEAFSQAMAEEELGYNSSLPQSVVKHAQKVFSDESNVEPSTMEKVKSNLSVV
jgi:hypothetical protein